jgi:DNA polymerase III alpha subunit (gram-positive type)
MGPKAMQFPDVMIDLETTGLAPNNSAIIQIGAVRFNLKERTIGDMFNQSMTIPYGRFWDEGTRNWWAQRGQVYQDIMSVARPPAMVMTQFAQWCEPINSMRFWAKPLSFDFPFLQSYFTQFDLQFPFDFRQANDMNTFIRSLYFPEPMPQLDVPFQGDAHNALMDSIHQISVLFAHMDHAKR